MPRAKPPLSGLGTTADLTREGPSTESPGLFFTAEAPAVAQFHPAEGSCPQLTTSACGHSLGVVSSRHTSAFGVKLPG